VTEADDELVDSMGGIGVHYMPQDRMPADFHHQFQANGSFFGKSRAKSACKYDRFLGCLSIIVWPCLAHGGSAHPASPGYQQASGQTLRPGPPTRIWHGNPETPRPSAR
jgi:hypothetical protein